MYFYFLVDMTEMQCSSVETCVQVDFPENSMIAALKRDIDKLKATLRETRKPTSFVSVSNDRSRFYTGLTCQQRKCLWEFLGPDKYDLKIWGFKELSSANFYVPLEDQFTLTLIKLRRNTDFTELSDLFGYNRGHIASAFTTWLQFMYLKFTEIKTQMFIERDQIPKPLPKCFQNSLLKNTRIVVDCTEFKLESSENFKQQGNQWSNYKSHSTAKVLIGTGPNGFCSFISHCYEGSISDREIVLKSGFLEYLNPNDLVLADRGFIIEDLLAERGAKLNIPPFLRKRSSFSLGENMNSKMIARARIHVERFNQRLKRFKYLQGVIPQSKIEFLSQAVYVCCCLTNFDQPLAK